MFLTREERAKREERRARRIWMERMIALVVLPPIFIGLWWGGSVAYEYLTGPVGALLQ